MKLVSTHNECGDITKLLADYAKQNSKRETLTTAVVTMYEAEITKLKEDVYVNQLSVNQKAKIKTEMMVLEEICDQNIRGCSVLESAESINPTLFKEMLEALSKKCPLVYEMLESLVVSNPRSWNILKTSTRFYVAYKH